MTYNQSKPFKGNAFGRLLHRTRKLRKYTLKRVGQAVGVTAQYIWDLENGKRGSNVDPMFAIKLADFLQIPYDTILSLTGVEASLEKDNFLRYLKGIAGKTRAAQIQHAIDGLRETISYIVSEAGPGITWVSRECEKLKSFVNDLDAAIRG